MFRDFAKGNLKEVYAYAVKFICAILLLVLLNIHAVLTDADGNAFRLCFFPIDVEAQAGDDHDQSADDEI